MERQLVGELKRHHNHTGNPEDVMAKSKEFLRGYLPEDKDLIQSMNNAWKIYTNVFGDDNQGNYGQIQNFLNFFQIVKEEFLTIGEMLPNLGGQTSNQVENEFAKEIQKEIDKYYRMLGRGLA